jgi:hypothetical protein
MLTLSERGCEVCICRQELQWGSYWDIACFSEIHFLKFLCSTIKTEFCELVPSLGAWWRESILVFCSDEAWFELCGYVTSQNNGVGFPVKPRSAITWCQVTVGCAARATRTIGLILFSDTTGTHRYSVTAFGHRSDNERAYAFCQQDRATVNTAKKAERCLQCF